MVILNLTHKGLTLLHVEYGTTYRTTAANKSKTNMPTSKFVHIHVIELNPTRTHHFELVHVASDWHLHGMYNYVPRQGNIAKPHAIATNGFHKQKKRRYIQIQAFMRILK